LAHPLFRQDAYRKETFRRNSNSPLAYYSFTFIPLAAAWSFRMARSASSSAFSAGGFGSLLRSASIYSARWALNSATFF
jgi:hypothetical protein